MIANTNIFSTLEKYSSGTSEIQTAENYVNHVLYYLLKKSKSFEQEILNKAFDGNIPTVLQEEHTIYSQYSQGRDIYDLIFMDCKRCISLVIELKVGSPVDIKQLKRYHANTKARVVLISLEDPKSLKLKSSAIRAFHWDDVDKASHVALNNESDPVPRFLLKEFSEFLSAHGLQEATLESLPKADVHKLKVICDETREIMPYESRPSGLKESKIYQGYNIYVDKKRHKNKIIWGWGISFVYSVKPTSPDCSGLVLFLWAWGIYDSHFCRALYENLSIRQMLEKESFKYGEDNYKPYWIKKLDTDRYKTIPPSEASIMLSNEVSRTIKFLQGHKDEIGNCARASR